MSPRGELTVEEREAIARAATLGPAEYGRARQALAEQLGIGVGFLDAEVQSIRSRNGGLTVAVGQGSALALSDPKLCQEPVDGLTVLDELTETFTRFLALPNHAANALALWTLHAHAHDAAEISPFLAITSPVLGCGKTTLLEILGALAPRPLPAANLTAAVTFRMIEKFRPTLLVDEADTFIRNSDELRGVLNSGHRRGSAFIPRSVGDDHEPRIFSTWSPKVIALIGRLPGTLADRSIEITMRRRTSTEQVERMRLDRLGELEPLRQRAWTWAQVNLAALQAADPDVPEKLRDRAADNWRPLIAIADLAGGEWPTRARKAALALSGAAVEDDEPPGVLAIEDVASLFHRRGTDRLGSQTIVDYLISLDERPWPEWSHGQPLSPRALARLLAPFGIKPKQVRVDAVTTLKGYCSEDFTDALTRYRPHSDPKQSEHPKQWLDSGPDGVSEERNVSEAELTGKLPPARVVSGVPLVSDEITAPREKDATTTEHQGPE
jgi:putative DNA primase/helicase